MNNLPVEEQIFQRGRLILEATGHPVKINDIAQAFVYTHSIEKNDSKLELYTVEAILNNKWDDIEQLSVSVNVKPEQEFLGMLELKTDTSMTFRPNLLTLKPDWALTFLWRDKWIVYRHGAWVQNFTALSESFRRKAKQSYDSLRNMYIDDDGLFDTLRGWS